VFASAADWPGWARSGRDEAAAVEALLGHAARYAVVAGAAGLAPAGVTPAGTFPVQGWRVEVTERLPGSATTDFGAPDAVAQADHVPVGAADGRRLAALLAACWERLDQVAAASPEELRKGPRGGGRDRSAIVGHVVRAEFSYARKLGVRHRESEQPEAVAAVRAELLEVVAAGRPAGPVRGREWPVRYAVRRFAWHVLDHAWEIEDRRPGD
jgi:hypothetical protein